MGDSAESKDKAGPLQLLRQAVRDQTKILVLCRNNRKILANVQAYDRHSNLLLTNVREFWTERARATDESGKKVTKRVVKDRFFSRILLRGDNVVVVVRDPH